jgi:transposase InsO family protein
VEILADERSEAACAFLANAAYCSAHQHVRIERVMTDNGSPFVSRRFREQCAVLGVHHKRIRPHRPQTNGKAERFIQTLLGKWAYRFAYDSSAERKRWLSPYVHFYNYHRAHSVLGHNPPISRLDRNNVPTRNS